MANEIAIEPQQLYKLSILIILAAIGTSLTTPVTPYTEWVFSLCLGMIILSLVLGVIGIFVPSTPSSLAKGVKEDK